MNASIKTEAKHYLQSFRTIFELLDEGHEVLLLR